MELEEARSWIKQQIGLFRSGDPTIDKCVEIYTADYLLGRDLKFIDKFKYNNVAIVGCFPLTLALLLRYLNINVTIIEKFYLLEKFKQQLEQYNIKVIETNPLFNQIDVSQYDLVVYYQNEDFVPFDCLRYNHNTDVLVFNSFVDHYRYNTNVVTHEDELVDNCSIEKLYDAGRVKFVNNRYTYFVHGRSL